jgi:hypothetical protein
MRIATGEEPEDYGDAPRKNQAAAELGRAKKFKLRHYHQPPQVTENRSEW